MKGYTTGDGGFTLVETLASLALLGVLSVIAYGIIQSTDHMMRYGSRKGELGQITRTAIEEIKELARLDQSILTCDGSVNDFALPADYWATYTCIDSQEGITRLQKVELTVREGSVGGEPADTFSFYVTGGGY